MTKKSMALKQIADYMAKKGKVLTLAEYNAETDTPIRSVMVKRIFGGSWARMEGMLKVAYPELYEAPKPAPAPKKTVAKAKVEKKDGK
ncbi:MAG TPA: hypothetical protein DCM40_06720 [Maribacter sp.]|jgi:hypothetical protein|nr:hypothetical protein [Maribacter sp.]|tara:strand:+ start:1458 stop:1721 length:264 start_codon:yes stop_codon:yes gene_type:complete